MGRYILSKTSDVIKGRYIPCKTSDVFMGRYILCKTNDAISILIMTQYPSILFKTHKTSTKNPRLLTIGGAIWFCRYRQCTTRC